VRPILLGIGEQAVALVPAYSHGREPCQRVHQQESLETKMVRLAWSENYNRGTICLDLVLEAHAQAQRQLIQILNMIA
jgi:hypothetical protein